MRVSLPVKLTLLMALGVGTSLVTSTILSRVKRAHAASPLADTPSVYTAVNTFVRQNPPGYQSPPHPPDRDRRSISTQKFKMQALDVVGKSVHIKAASSIAVTREGASYVWAVHVLDPKDDSKVFYERIYDHQVFPVPPGEYVRPTFDDEFDLAVAPGVYEIRVGAYPIPRETGLAGVRFDRPRLGAVGGGYITVEN
jgi:hypothetical protein